MVDARPEPTYAEKMRVPPPPPPPPPPGLKTRYGKNFNMCRRSANTSKPFVYSKASQP